MAGRPESSSSSYSSSSSFMALGFVNEHKYDDDFPHTPPANLTSGSVPASSPRLQRIQKRQQLLPLRVRQFEVPITRGGPLAFVHADGLVDRQRATVVQVWAAFAHTPERHRAELIGLRGPLLDAV